MAAADMSSGVWRFWIDTGGTFTDCLAEDPSGRRLRAKALSDSSLRGEVVAQAGPRTIHLSLKEGYGDGFFAGYELQVFAEGEVFFAEIKGWEGGEGIARLATDLPEGLEGSLVSIQSPEEPPVFVARILTETKLDEELPALDMRLATTRGTNALLENKGAKTAFFVTKGFRDLLRIGNQQRPDLFAIGIQKAEPVYSRVYEIDERLDAEGKIERSLDEVGLRACAEECVEAGIESVAVALLHSYLDPSHELQVKAVLHEAGLRRVSLSSELSPFIKILPRAETAVVDAYLAPIMEAYLDAVEGRLSGGKLRVMNSAGGLAGRRHFRPKDSLLSGPAGGVVGAAAIGMRAGKERTIVFDMGGTSTDVSRFDGALDYRYEQRIGAARVYAPSLRIETVAAGGGSICWFDGTAPRVGPQSAGASPGPACYGAGGPLTLTDVNLLLGRLDASRFSIPVDRVAAAARLDELIVEVEKASSLLVKREELLEGFLAVANERMADAIRGVSISEGYDVAGYAMVAFGGAGGLHACAIAEMLSMDAILFPADSGLLSAYGLEKAKVERIEEEQILRRLSDCEAGLPARFEALQEQAFTFLLAEGERKDLCEVASRWCEMRFLGQESSLQIVCGDVAELAELFRSGYRNQFGFLPEDLEIEVVAIRVSARAKGAVDEGERFEKGKTIGGLEGAFVDRADLKSGDCLEGPVVVQDNFSTLFVDTGWKAVVGSLGTLLLEKTGVAQLAAKERNEVVELELYTNRFLSIVGKMGALLERTAFSTNVKERRDYSCALLDSDGRLVANAPHIPVHLGALGVCLRKTLEALPLGEGDVVVTNHPGFGGSHLPDVTLLAAVYSDDGDLIGYVANRAHHAEIGGISPGSMPPKAQSLAEEGAVIAPMYLVKAGDARWDELESVLKGGAYPTRRIRENVADLSAQLASIRMGEAALRALACKEGSERIGYYLRQLRERATLALREGLRACDFSMGRAEELLDSGAKICVSARMEGEWLTIDFEGSAAVQRSSYNATEAVVTSAVIYALRLLARADVPLNEGFLDVVTLRIPEGMLNPHFASDAALCPPVVAGNVEVSQRVVDALIRVFGLAACSQGTMNNLIFGNEDCSYYETIAGGEGASAERAGADAVHTHMTNTAITDPEVFERRYPVRLESFSVREGSGGAGARRGGDGVTRRIRFLGQVSASMLAQHRVEAPFGVAGGQAGACGEQYLTRAEGGKREQIFGDFALEIEAGDILEIRTPGGGGWGRF